MLFRYSINVHKEIEGTNKHIKKLIGYVGQNLKYPNIESLDEYINKYEKYFVERLESIEFKLYPYPDVTHEKIVQKAIAKTKPFKSNGTGYCDALIWETVLEVLNNESDCEVIFVTNNTQDFFDGEQLSQELKNDLIGNNILPNRVKAFVSLKDVVDELLLPHLGTMETLIEQINGNAIPGVDVHEWIDENMFNVIDHEDAGFVIAGVNKDECKTEVSEIYEVSSVKAVDAKILSETEIYILINTEFGMSVNVCANYGQYEDSSNVTEIFDRFGMGAPTPYDCVQISNTVTVDLSVIIRNNDFTSASMELLQLSGPEGFVDYEDIVKKRMGLHDW